MSEQRKKEPMAEEMPQAEPKPSYAPIPQGAESPYEPDTDSLLKLMVAAYLLNAFMAVVGLDFTTHPNRFLLVLALIANAVFTIALMNWKKWGIYGLIVSIIVIVTIDPSHSWLWFIPLALVVLIIFPHWKQMD